MVSTANLVLGPSDSKHVVLFAAGAGGDPQRYLPLLQQLASAGCHVIAPSFERIDGATADAELLVARPQGLVDALERVVPSARDVAVVGHSIGGWAALCLAGAMPRDRDGVAVEVPSEPRIGRLVLYAPAAGWFWAPGALDAVTAPMRVFVGDRDTVTPVEQARLLNNAPADVDLRVIPGAGHFSFMHTPPPGYDDDPDFRRDQFLTDLAETTAEFLVR